MAATYFKQAAKRGTKLVVMDPRGMAMKRHATWMLQFKPGSDVAMLNAIMHVIVAEELYDRQYVQAHTEGFERLKAHSPTTRPRPWPRSAASRPRPCARSPAPSPAPSAAMVFWGMGVSQHVHGTDNARCLISLVMMCGHVGRPGTGLHPLRGQNNVQGASDAGLIPMVFPDYNSVGDTIYRTILEALWGVELDRKPGLTVVEIIDAIHAGRIKAMYIMGENPAMSDPDAHHAREALAQARASGGPGHLPDRDRDVRRRGAPGLGLAREDRHGDQHQPSRADGPPGPAAAGRGAPTGGSPRSWPAASAWTGATPARPRCSPR